MVVIEVETEKTVIRRRIDPSEEREELQVKNRRVMIPTIDVSGALKGGRAKALRGILEQDFVAWFYRRFPDASYITVIILPSCYV